MSYNISPSLSDLLHLVWQSIGPFMLLQMHYFILFNGWVIFHCIYVPHLYPFLCWWTFVLLPCLGCCNSASMNMGVHLSFQIVVLSRYMPQSGIAGSYGNSIFSFLRNFHTVLHSGCTDLHSHRQYGGGVPFFLPLLKHLLFAEFLIMAIVIAVRWYLVVVLICIFLVIRDVDRLFMCFLAICIGEMSV